MLILASASPRRRELLRRICPDFAVEASDVDETLDAGPIAPAVAALALRKARAVARRAGRGVVLAADTVVVLGGEVLGKPAGPAEARAMLRRLRGRGHEVWTGVAVVDAATGRAASATARTRVLMAGYPEATLDAYVASGAPLDKAGAYAIQDLGGRLVDGLVGSYTNVVGLPVEAARRLLAGFGLPVSAPAAP
ncbi:MAG: septum formation protein Maf [Candidatus Rokubacteria bacterium RIFCSPLOWO2_02_FULL_73_56]|nr:MAG: septum formation protein Maf [Candidatus Rokubacteria bacterium RIFCSPHIGHO2_02_FULL_73_26]OGL09062.1 MAG: septum formation protein Maf [Candidatus Rokubacteria bacterium RIFCSPLOWO2_02_FULL_73_56]OGL28187.1 MAG: septum formation protein Maf [Candidatus Rokubacteria bacterium RIFCSPLOWO2_12_FULL_73_47]